MKNALILLVLSLLSLSAFADSDKISFYGLAFVGFESTNIDNKNETDVKSYNSRFGAKGASKLDENLEVFYTLEFGVDLSDESGEKNVKSRSQFVGLRGVWGEVLIGRYDTALKLTQGKIDLFNHQSGDIKMGGAWKGENRMSDSISFKSPKFGHVNLAVTYVSEEGSGGDAGTSVALYYGDKNLAKTAVYAAIGHDTDIKGYDTTRASIQFKLAKLKLGLIYQNQENIATGDDFDGGIVSASYKINKVTLKSQFQELEDDNAFSVGLDYKFNSKTKIFTFYTEHNLDSSTDKDWLSLGIQHKF